MRVSVDQKQRKDEGQEDENGEATRKELRTQRWE